MRILMLGWEFPPFIAGGLGVACYGLTRALDQLGHRVTFILPRPVDRSHTSHVTLLSPDSPPPAPHSARSGPGRGTGASIGQAGGGRGGGGGLETADFSHASFLEIPATFAHPYNSASPMGPVGAGSTEVFTAEALQGLSPEAVGLPAIPSLPHAPTSSHAPGMTGMHLGAGGGAGHGYGPDLFGDADRYARLCVSLTHGRPYDLIHAHDWLTYPAGVALSLVTGKPLVVHVHSTEFDRSGDNINQAVYDIERRGMHAAARVVAVSQLTKDICVRRYGVPADRIDVIYNGIDRVEQDAPMGSDIEEGDKVVLFLGRITMQKGPEYFIAAAKRVLERVDNVKFVVAGSGDMALRMVELAAAMGIGHRVLFTGFLRGRDVDRVFKMADCYVMPSVSEPFGLAALEAIHHDVPVILSKTAGAAEVLTHVLKVDFWDTDEIANKIVAVLRHPPLSRTLREHGCVELRRLTWTGAAERCLASYRLAVGQPAPVAV